VAADVARAVQVAEILKAVAHPLRLRIVALLCEGELKVNALAERLGASQAIVSQQLRILRMHRLVIAVRQNGYASYRLLEPRLRDLVMCVEGCAHS
jgi:DNA-binding transcriptional ArsR family regulator